MQSLHNGTSNFPTFLSVVQHLNVQTAYSNVPKEDINQESTNSNGQLN